MRVNLDLIAVAMSVTKRWAERRAQRESWPFELEAVRGGYRKRFALGDLPLDVRQAVERHKHIPAIDLRSHTDLAWQLNAGKHVGRWAR